MAQKLTNNWKSDATTRRSIGESRLVCRRGVCVQRFLHRPEDSKDSQETQRRVERAPPACRRPCRR